MKGLVNITMLFATISFVSTQITSIRHELSANPLYHEVMRPKSDPATACAVAGAPGPWPDPDDCTKFYYCTGPGVANPPFALSCGDPYQCFDPASGDCSEDKDACITACETNGPTCKERCTQPGEQVSHPTNCNLHYICDINNNPVEMRCFDATKPFFNGYECVSDEAQCCTCRARTCDGETMGASLMDPQDCHSFYTCIGNPLEPVGPSTCPDNGVFNPTSKRCDSSTTTCTNACNIGGGVTTTKAPSSDCTDIGSFRCPGKGFYARCSFCDPSFFKCDRAGGNPTQGACSGDLVFNPNPQYPYCVLPGNCPIS